MEYLAHFLYFSQKLCYECVSIPKIVLTKATKRVVKPYISEYRVCRWDYLAMPLGAVLPVDYHWRFSFLGQGVMSERMFLFGGGSWNSLSESVDEADEDEEDSVYDYQDLMHD
jgi:hypothetical protein